MTRRQTAWLPLRRFRDACDAYTALMVRDPREWLGCAHTQSDELKWAAQERHERWQEAITWGLQLRFRVEEHAAAEGTPMVEDSMFNINRRTKE